MDGNRLINQNAKNSDSDSINHGQPSKINIPNSGNYSKGGVVSNKLQSKENETNEPGGNDPPVKKKMSGKFLITIICFTIIYNYYSFVFKLKPILKPNEENFTSRLIILIIYHYLLFMMIWAYIVTIRTIPGFIPLYWGFYIGDEEYKRKRYCLICNAFKPERSHHCSVCNICVLNMDHHCPWVNNCIGFYNRKFFMQLLFYLFMLTWFITTSCFQEIFTSVKHIYTHGMHIGDEKMIEYFIVIPSYLIVCILTVLNTMFFKYHIELVINNSTTIESLDPENKEISKFKLTTSENWVQVFGFDKLLWFFPLFSERGRPHGDGLNWKLNSAFEMNIMNNSHPGSQSGNNHFNQSSRINNISKA